MSYRVFARKYRPQTFDEVVGQGHITRTLQNAIAQNRLAQAYLFVGPRGIGKTSTARILAKALNCEKGPTVNPCGVCDACREIAAGNSLDVLEIDGASNNSVDHIRELRENAAFAPAKGPYKIYLVDEVHMLSTAAFNALLKTLEEPPAHVKFIFATTEAQKVPATITSRCQRFDLRRIPADLIAGHLQHIATQEKVALDDAAAAAVAKGADGGLRDAESMLDQLVAFCGDRITAEDVLTVFGFTSGETVETLCGHVFARDAAGALALVAEQAAAGKDLSRLMADVIAHVRDLLVRSVQPGAEVPVAPERLLALLDHFSEAEGRLRWATDKRLYFDVAVIKAVHLLSEASLSDVIETLSAIGQGEVPPPVSRPAPPPPPARRMEASPPPAAAAVPAPAPKAIARAEAPAPSSEPASAEPEPVAFNLSVIASEIDGEPAAAGPVPVADAPAPAVEAVPVDANDPAAVWRAVAENLAAESFFSYGWLTSGEFDRLDEEGFRVRFPAAEAHLAELPRWKEQCAAVESSLGARLGRRVRFLHEFTEELAGAAPPVSAPEPEEEPTPEPEAAATTDPAKAAALDFQNDPLIQKALEIFKAKIQTT